MGSVTIGRFAFCFRLHALVSGRQRNDRGRRLSAFGTCEA